jgi:Flp pilus assembly protein TadG
MHRLLRGLRGRTPDRAGRELPGARLWRQRGGNIAVITALVMIPLTFALGMAFDFTLAQSRKDQIDGMADVAALGSVTPSMMTGSAANSKTQATGLFGGQIATVSGVTYSPTNLTVTSNDTTILSKVTRTVTVTYSAGSQNVFASLLGMNTFPISGTSTATSSVSPNIDFYLLLDTSPSMEIAATTSGINTLQAATTAQQPSSTPAGCAFGCHESNPTAGDTVGNPGGEDNYTLARNLGVTMRIDLVNQATQNLMSVAQTTETSSGATYRAAIYTIDTNYNALQVLTANLSTAKTSAANIAALEVYSNNNVTKSNNNQDEDTSLDTGLSDVNTTMPNPGNGTNNKGDTPQAVLFIVTDGLNDESVGGTRTYAPMDQSGAALCTAIKNRGIRIAVLYTTYNPLDTGAVGGSTWYDQHVEAVQPNIAPAAQACASPGLYFEVNTDGDITSALAMLFQKAVATARLTQ